MDSAPEMVAGGGVDRVGSGGGGRSGTGWLPSVEMEVEMAMGDMAMGAPSASDGVITSSHLGSALVGAPKKRNK